jgi:hypothetical protein
LCFAVPDEDEGDEDGVAAAEDVFADDVCDVTAVDAEPVDALAMVSPSPRLAPRTPAPMAVPSSGLIRTMVSSCLLPAGRSRPAPATGRGDPLIPVGRAILGALSRRPLSRR